MKNHFLRYLACMLVTLLMVAALIIAWLLIADIAGAGERMLCHLEPSGANWHYRTKIAPLMDAKCWYDGPRMKDRSELYWAESPRVAPAMLPIDNAKPPWELEQRFHGAPEGREHKE